MEPLDLVRRAALGSCPWCGEPTMTHTGEEMAGCLYAAVSKPLGQNETKDKVRKLPAKVLQFPSPSERKKK